MDADRNLTQHFKWGEFWCKGKEPPMKYYDNILEVAVELEKLRAIICKPIRINSGWRSVAYNKKIGGSSRSKHLTGEAADVRAIGFDNRELGYFACKYTNFGGIGKGRTYHHLDTREGLTIWFY